MFSKKLTPEEKYYKNMEHIQKKLNSIESKNSRSRQGYKNFNDNNNKKSGGSFLGFIAAALFMAGGFYLFTITVPKIGGEEFEVDKVTSIVDVVQTGKLPDRDKSKTNTEDAEPEPETEEASASDVKDKIKGLASKSFGAEGALTGGGDVIEKGKAATAGFMTKFSSMFAKKPKEDKQKSMQLDKKTNIAKTGQSKTNINDYRIQEHRVFLDEKLKEKNKLNENGEIVNDLSYYEK